MRLEDYVTRVNVINISIHAPLTGCDMQGDIDRKANKTISIHAPLTGCDDSLSKDRRRSIIFQSTHPLRDATSMQLWWIMNQIISIHAPLTGCDRNSLARWSNAYNFNPRTPYGMRLNSLVKGSCENNFNPRTPYGMRQGEPLRINHKACISIHAPLTGCDFKNIR